MCVGYSRLFATDGSGARAQEEDSDGVSDARIHTRAAHVIIIRAPSL